MQTSVVVCTKNRPDNLVRCIDSLADQTILPNEVIIVDDGCLSESIKGDIKDKLGTKGVAYKYIKKIEPGLTKSRNQGIKTTNGDVIFFLDDDVILDEKYIEKILEIYTDDKELEIGGVGGREIKPKFLGRFRPHIVNLFGLNSYDYGKVLPSGFPANAIYPEEIREVQFLSGCNMSFRKKVFDDFLFDEFYTGYGLGEDLEFTYRVSKRYKLVYTPYAKVIHTRSPSGRVDYREFGFQRVYNTHYLVDKYFKKTFKNRLLFWWSIVGIMFTNFIDIGRKENKVDEIRGNIDAIRRITPQWMKIITPSKIRLTINDFLLACNIDLADNGFSRIRRGATYFNLLNYFEKRSAKEQLKKYLKFIEIEVFSYCNRLCKWCPNVYIDRHSVNVYLAEDVYLKILRELSEIEYDGVISYGRYNEPLADKLILKRIKQARQMLPKAKLITFSNGDYLSKEYLQELRDAGLDALTVECYVDYYTREIGKDACRSKMETLGLYDYSLVHQSDDYGVRYAAKFPKMHLKFECLNLLKTGCNRGGVNIRDYVRTADCVIPFYRIYIDYNGNIMPCPNVRSDIKKHELFILGRVESESLGDVFSSPKFNKFRKSVLGFMPKKSVCRNCSGCEEKKTKIKELFLGYIKNSREYKEWEKSTAF